MLQDNCPNWGGFLDGILPKMNILESDLSVSNIIRENNRSMQGAYSVDFNIPNIISERILNVSCKNKLE